MNKQGIVRQDLSDDFEEIIYLYNSLEENLEKFRKELIRARRYIAEENYNLSLRYYELLRKKIVILNNQVRRSLYFARDDRRDARDDRRDARDDDVLRKKKYKHQELLRLYSNLCSSLLTSSDWQSPSFSHSLTSAAGRQTGKITGTVNDYKRDVHLDEIKYETAFLKEYTDSDNKFFLKAYLTNSGQAAFQTILTYLLSENKVFGKVLVGENSYFQYKQILKGTFGNKLIFFDEMKTGEILKQIQDDKPSAVFIDSLCNSSEIAVPNLSEIMKFIYKNAKLDIYLIIDNTCLAVSFQPFASLRVNPLKNKVHLITFESLNKYYQFGLDRVTGGIIVCENRDAAGIFEYRKHAGTNISDSSVYSLPKPNRKLLTRRLKRHQRNAVSLSQYLESMGSEKIEKIIYPENREYFFKGSFFNIKFTNKWDSVKKMKKFINSIIKAAGEKKVNIIGGTSFGLNTTRIYLTSLWSKPANPFLRVSLGTEDFLELQKIKAVFQEAIK